MHRDRRREQQLTRDSKWTWTLGSDISRLSPSSAFHPNTFTLRVLTRFPRFLINSLPFVSINYSTPLLAYSPCRDCPPNQGWASNADFEGDNTTIATGGDSTRTKGTDPGFVTSAPNATVGLNFTGKSRLQRQLACTRTTRPTLGIFRLTLSLFHLFQLLLCAQNKPGFPPMLLSPLCLQHPMSLSCASNQPPIAHTSVFFYASSTTSAPIPWLDPYPKPDALNT